MLSARPYVKAAGSMSITASASEAAISRVPSREPESTTMTSAATDWSRSARSVRSIVAASSFARTMTVARAGTGD
jgi:hypothetical protein